MAYCLNICRINALNSVVAVYFQCTPCLHGQTVGIHNSWLHVLSLLVLLLRKHRILLQDLLPGDLFLDQLLQYIDHRLDLMVE